MPSEDVWKAIHELTKLHHENSLQQAILNTQVGSLVKKLDSFIEIGAPRCAAREERIKSVESFRKWSMRIFLSLFMTMIGAGVWLWKSGIK